MLTEFFSKSMAVAFMIFVSTLCLIIKAASQVKTVRLLKQSENLIMAGDKSLKELRIRYESAYRLNKGRVNAKAMTEDFVNSIQLAGLPAIRTEKIHIFSAVLCMLFSVCGFSVLYLSELPFKKCASFFLYGSCISLITFTLGMALSVHKLCEVRASLLDYLENSLCARLSMESENNDKEKRPRQGMRDDLFMKKEEPETGLEIYKEETSTAPVSGRAGIDSSADRGSRKLSDKDEQLIADVLKEYLRQASGK